MRIISGQNDYPVMMIMVVVMVVDTMTTVKVHHQTTPIMAVEREQTNKRQHSDNRRCRSTRLFARSGGPKRGLGRLNNSSSATVVNSCLHANKKQVKWDEREDCVRVITEMD